jgi:hypothetical protein
VLEIFALDMQQQNGVAEQFNQMTHECALSMLKKAGMSNGFDQKLTNIQIFRSPTSALNLTTPYEVFYNKKPDVSTLHIFGSCCHIRIAKDKHKKLNMHSLDGILCGFADQSKAYKV